MHLTRELEEELKETLRYILSTEEDDFRERILSGEENDVQVIEDYCDAIAAGGEEGYRVMDFIASHPDCKHIYARAYRLWRGTGLGESNG